MPNSPWCENPYAIQTTKAFFIESKLLMCATFWRISFQSPIPNFFSFILAKRKEQGESEIPSRELKNPTWGNGTSSSKLSWEKDMLVPWRVYKLTSCEKLSGRWITWELTYLSIQGHLAGFPYTPGKMKSWSLPKWRWMRSMGKKSP